MPYIIGVICLILGLAAGFFWGDSQTESVRKELKSAQKQIQLQEKSHQARVEELNQKVEELRSKPAEAAPTVATSIKKTPEHKPAEWEIERAQLQRTISLLKQQKAPIQKTDKKTEQVATCPPPPDTNKLKQALASSEQQVAALQKKLDNSGALCLKAQVPSNVLEKLSTRSEQP